MALKNIRAGTAGGARRKLTSWIERFVSYASEEDTPEIYRRWAAITAIGSCLEQKVWVTTTAPLYPNLYTLLVGPPAIGKSRSIGCVRSLLATLPDFPFAPDSVTMASLVDSLKESERKIIIHAPDPAHIYNSMALFPHDLQVLMSSYDVSLIAGLTAFFDTDHPYREQRRTGDLRIEIKRPQLSILGGTTPSHLFGFIPEEAWSQGFTSRLILVYSDERPKPRVRFNDVDLRRPDDLVHDLKIINSLKGEFKVDEKAVRAFENWREAGEPPVPSHKRLEHYLGRRYIHMLKLSMVSAIDRGNALVISVDDFNRALGWLVEVENAMPRVFQEGPRTVESKIMEEFHYYLKTIDILGKGVAESRLRQWVLQRVSLLQYDKFWPALVAGGYIKCVVREKGTNEARWVAVDRPVQET